jgi:hypothetical protein
MIIPVANLKSVSPFDNMFASLFEPSQKISMSSTKSRWVMASPFEILIPEKHPPTFSSVKNGLSFLLQVKRVGEIEGSLVEFPSLLEKSLWLNHSVEWKRRSSLSTPLSS